MKEEIIKMYINDNLNASEIARIINCHHSTISLALKNWDIPKRSMKQISRKFKVNESYFKQIDTEDKAYWLGFIYADGYLTNGNQIGITLGRKDKEHIEKFLKSIASNYEIKDYESDTGFGKVLYSRVIITSEKMYSDLYKLGVMENKTLELTFPNIDRNLLNHFVRGYFDGDGSLSGNVPSVRFKVCGTKEFLKSLIDILNREIVDYQGTFNYKFYKRYKERDINNYYISYGGNIKVRNIMNYIYKDSTIYLDRKYNKYEFLKNS